MIPSPLERTPPEIATMPPRVTLSSADACLFVCSLTLASLTPAQAALSQTGQASPSNRTAHGPVCADGVRRYVALDSVPTPFDTLTMPRGAPIRITSPDQEQAAERQMMERAGSVGATGVVVHDEVLDGGAGMRRVSRRVIPVFVPSDSARAQAVCRRGSGDSASSAKSDGAISKAEAHRSAFARPRGHSPGSNTAPLRNVGGKLYTIVLANVDPPAAPEIAEASQRWLR